jgi:hypothetical protein
VEPDNTGNIPSVFLLDQNYPNPFNPVTTIGYSLPFSGMVELTVYDVLGKNVATIVSERQSAGYHRVVWNAADQSSGVYFYHLKSGNHQAVRRMILMR